ncbi:preprotein translocase subunit YajC [Nicoliella spurrieriana]|uniref:Preprotein translocase subunit YajC n=1 Tax=Nicoliella spurrieriana TaxID=2925830 RepID=A0A976RS09_9LACO|nr:preprotein translocase subunit YajC [Nicoliella spurrieriana]UQS86793.1 preprotein translocase subunit YajC [Nicoliella spurrieriana]
MQYSSLIFIVIIIVVMYFTMIRPQKRRQQEHQQTINNIKKGDQVVTIGRLHGVVDSINRDTKTVTLDCDGIYLEFDLNAIASVTAATAADTNEAASSASADAEPAKSAESNETAAKSDADNQPAK